MAGEGIEPPTRGFSERPCEFRGGPFRALKAPIRMSLTSADEPFRSLPNPKQCSDRVIASRLHRRSHRQERAGTFPFPPAVAIQQLLAQFLDLAGRRVIPYHDTHGQGERPRCPHSSRSHARGPDHRVAAGEFELRAEACDRGRRCLTSGLVCASVSTRRSPILAQFSSAELCSRAVVLGAEPGSQSGTVLAVILRSCAGSP